MKRGEVSSTLTWFVAIGIIFFMGVIFFFLVGQLAGSDFFDKELDPKITSDPGSDPDETLENQQLLFSFLNSQIKISDGSVPDGGGFFSVKDLILRYLETQNKDDEDLLKEFIEGFCDRCYFQALSESDKIYVGDNFADKSQLINSNIFVYSEGKKIKLTFGRGE